MGVSSVFWKLASPYDAYVSHVARLTEAMERIRSLSGLALGHEAGLMGSVRLVPNGNGAADARAAGFRERLGSAADEMTDEQFEAFISMLGSGETAAVEADRARAASRMQHAARGLEEYFAIAGQELALLEKRGYNPNRPDVARQLRENGLPAQTVAEYAHELRTLGTSVGRRPA
ncbi:MAG: hypothetical protein R3B97_08730 [Dehalococcoidia bacterium]|nr:hypothetical protein [Dehalococcoidia bacterium]